MKQSFEKLDSQLQIGKWKNVFWNEGSKDLKGLPTDVTTNINYGCQVNKPAGRAINFALYLMDNHFEQLTLIDIKRLLHEIMGCNVSKTTVQRWAKKYRPNLNYRMSRDHHTQWNKNISLAVWYHYQKNNTKAQKSHGEQT